MPLKWCQGYLCPAYASSMVSWQTISQLTCSCLHKQGVMTPVWGVGRPTANNADIGFITNMDNITRDHGVISQIFYKLIIEILKTFYICSYFNFDYTIRSQFCTCHDSWAVMACAKLEPDLIIIFHLRWAVMACAKLEPDLIIIFHLSTKCFCTRLGSWAHTPFVKWIQQFPPTACITTPGQHKQVLLLYNIEWYKPLGKLWM